MVVKNSQRRDSSSRSCSRSSSPSSGSSISSSSGSSRSSSPGAKAAIAAVKNSPRQPTKTERKARQSPIKRERTPPMRPLKVYVSGLTQNVNKLHIGEIFGTCGAILSTVMPVDPIHPEFSRGYAYVTFETPESAEAAVKMLNRGQIDGQNISVSLMQNTRTARRSPVHYRRPMSPVRRYRSPARRRYSPHRRNRARVGGSRSSSR
ncbi:RNA-binding protein with serine-rich domain 1-like [Octopus sinensis]|uniref:RNA-binding protein with serine-rich domain 1-like n=1 Tax=Octopus sinensis TaxID=2607531 RepID=A0A7E6EGK2_9MOLL|nr:RNA-binding protein with serine-rich domain 1-like [Octopus sinensis]